MSKTLRATTALTAVASLAAAAMTSFAAPIISGIAARLLGERPNLTPVELEAIVGAVVELVRALEEIAGEHRGKVQIAKVNVDENQETAQNYGIRSIPTLALFKSGREVARQSGALLKSDIVRWVRAHA